MDRLELDNIGKSIIEFAEDPFYPTWLKRSLLLVLKNTLRTFSYRTGVHIE